MLCGHCREVLETVELQDSDGVMRVGPQKPQEAFLSLRQVGQSSEAGCCICMRINQTVGLCAISGDGSESIRLKYRVADLKGFFRVDVYAHLKPRKNVEELQDGGGETFFFTLLPGVAQCHSEYQSLCDTATSALDRTKRYIQWRMNNCSQTHSECRRGNWWRPEVAGIKEIGNFRPEKVEDVWQPTRLLRVRRSHGRDDTLVHLVETAENHCSSYAALSHCWGGKSNYKLQESSLAQLTAGIPCSTLPKTYREAVQVALWLNIEHIWIDSLCIKQDSAEDWAYEAAQMHRVYQFAQVTISASASENNDGGLFFDTQNVISNFVPALKLGGYTPGEYRIVDEQLWAASIDNAPLRKRAWTVQERLLSGRLLHFGKEEIFWQCAHTLECQSYPADTAWITTKDWSNGHCALKPRTSGVHASHQCAIHVLLAVRGNRLDSFRQMWQNIVRIYGRCDLTFQSDKLPAIGGLARLLHTWHGISYYAGLWEEGMIFQLFWNVRTCNQANGSPSIHPDEYIAPTWSWASVIGDIETELSNTPDNNFSVAHLAKVIDVEVEKESMTSFGHIKGGRLQIKGRIHAITLIRDSSNSFLWDITYQHNTVLWREMAQSDARTYWLVTFDIRPTSDSQQVVFLPLWHGLGLDMIYGLLLKAIEGEKRTYRRVGTLAIPRRMCHYLNLTIQQMSGSGPVSRTYSGSDIIEQDLQTLVIV